MFSFKTTLSGGLALALVVSAGLFAAGRPAAASDQTFFRSVAGTWKGPGRVVAGKYKGTRFYCDFDGDSLARGKTGLTLDGACRVGVFTQKMNAVISKASSDYTGHFLDGGKGDGLDVISGRVSPSKVVVGLNRKDLYGAMVARLTDADTMNITVSVKVGEQLVPVIGMTLARQDAPRTVGSIR